MFSTFSGQVKAHMIYPIAERLEKRMILKKLAELRTYYQLPFLQRKKIASQALIAMIEFAGHHVPYYRDLFKRLHFDCQKLTKDMNYLQALPLITKEMIREQGERLLSQPLENIRFHERKTGGSTGLSCKILYDQSALDYSAAIVLYARERIGKTRALKELHFASRFPDVFPWRDRLREKIKCMAMNRSNIFFAELDDRGLEKMLRQLLTIRPYLIHAHPSTIYALACYVEKTYGTLQTCRVFESSGELLQSYMRKKISDVLQCQVVDRYGLAELGVMAYEIHPGEMQIFESEGWIEPTSTEQSEMIVTSFRNQLMPLIRYTSGDLGTVIETKTGWVISNIMGRIHDVFSIAGTQYATHYMQDILDRVGGIQEFQLDLRNQLPKLLLVKELSADKEQIKMRLKKWWRDHLEICFVEHRDLIRVGERAKFRHVVV